MYIERNTFGGGGGGEGEGEQQMDTCEEQKTAAAALTTDVNPDCHDGGDDEYKQDEKETRNSSNRSKHKRKKSKRDRSEEKETENTTTKKKRGSGGGRGRGGGVDNLGCGPLDGGRSTSGRGRGRSDSNRRNSSAPDGGNRGSGLETDVGRKADTDMSCKSSVGGVGQQKLDLDVLDHQDGDLFSCNDDVEYLDGLLATNNEVI